MKDNKPEITFISTCETITAYGVRLLSSILRKEGYPTKIVFTPYILEKESDKSIDALASEIEKVCINSSILGFSLFSCHLPSVSKLSRNLKARLNIPIVWGGKHSTVQPRDAVGYADMVCVGEGETSIRMLMQAIEKGEDYGSADGIWVVKDGKVVEKPLAPLVQELDSLPYPDYSLDGHYLWDGNKMIEMDSKVLESHMFRSTRRKKAVYQTMFSRGCPYSCTYCSTFRTLYKGQKYLRTRSPQNVIDEIGKIVSRFPFIEEIALMDDNFLALPESQIEEFADLYKKKIGLHLRCLVHPHEVNKRKIELLVDAGMKSINMGVQAGSNNTLKLYKRATSSEKILDAVRAINTFKDDVMAFYDFIIDNPYESKADVLDTLRMITKFPRPYQLNIYSLTFFPGTELHKKAVDDGLMFDVTKTLGSENKNYLNFLFRHIYTRPFPQWLLGVLISRPVITVFDNKPMVSLLYFSMGTLKKSLRKTGE